jgi:hypothetical protein
MPLDDIKAQINKNTVQRLKKDADKAPQHTIYLGDRTVQRLGEEPIENAVILPNKALSIGEPLLPLASGDVLRRYDSANRGAYLGSAYRKALEADGITGAKLSMNGDNAMPDQPLSPQQNGGSGNGSFPPISPPPFGCAPPDKKCFWSTASTAPNGFQGYGDVVTSTGDRLFLYCAIGTTPPPDFGCDFLSKWSCFGGVCSRSPNGIYNSQAECEAALIPPNFTGGQCVGTSYIATVNYYRFLIAAQFPPFTGNFSQDVSLTGKIISFVAIFNAIDGIRILITHNNGLSTTSVGDASFIEGSYIEITSISITGTPDNCGNAPSTCP